MRNRWFHVPEVHCPGVAEKKVTWIELFYDLIFVAAFIQLGNGLGDNVTGTGFLSFAGMFVPLWITWTGFTFFSNRFTVDDFLHRIMVFIQMFAVGSMAVSAARVFTGTHEYFAFSYAIAQGTVALLYFRAYRQVDAAGEYSKYWGKVFGTGSALWFASGFCPTPYAYALWAIATLLVLSAPFSKHSRALSEEFPMDWEHLAERYGLLTIIVLGESFVKVLTVLSGSGATEWNMLLKASSTLLITCCIWWVYFDDVAGSKVKKGKLTSVVWLYAHLPMQIAVTAAGVGIKKMVGLDLGLTAPEAYRWLMCGTLALTFLGVALVDSVTERRQAELSDKLRVNVRVGSAVLILLLAPAGGSMSTGLFLLLVATMCVGQVVFDMMMAPYEAMPEHAKVEGIHEIAHRRAEGDKSAGEASRRTNLDNVVRKGAPSELRQDFYTYFMQGSWTRFFIALLFFYLIVNVFFAALYVLQPGCIANSRPNSFADAFYFSVQTFSTIGFGSLSPATTYGNVVVVAEAAIGLLTVAMATGVMMAKAGRPNTGVLFSSKMLIIHRHGVPTLTFRVGNAQGYEIVDANMTVTVLVDEITPEGEHLRRLHTLKLVRSMTPMFVLSWTVMHEIDEDSPLHGYPLDEIHNHVLRFIITMTGHDGVYGQTVYSRHNYYPEDIGTGEKFVDVLSELPDGRLMIDYHLFHDTVPLDEKHFHEGEEH